MNGPNYGDTVFTDLKLSYAYDNDNNSTTPTVQLYNYAYLNTVPEYSKLDYKTTDITINADYAIKENLTLNVGYLFSKLDDKKPYVYGDLDGTSHTVTANITYNF
ncbi:MAG: hypothetical protein OHK0040_05010 [bacterium]